MALHIAVPDTYLDAVVADALVALASGSPCAVKAQLEKIAKELAQISFSGPIAYDDDEEDEDENED